MSVRVLCHKGKAVAGGRQVFSCLFAFLSLAFLTACERDNYESGDGKYSNMRVDFVEAHTGSDGRLYSFMTDDGDSLLLQTATAYKWAATADSTYRALVYYNKVETSANRPQADVLSVSPVAVPPIRPAATVRLVKTDPVRLESAWLNQNRRYANLGINLLTGTTAGRDDKQVLGMLCDTLLRPADGHAHLRLRLYHDQNGVPEYYTARTFVSIPLQKSPYRLGTGDTLSITINTYDGEVVRRFIY